MRKMADREAEIQQLLRDKDHDCQEQVRSRQWSGFLAIVLTS